MYIDLQIVCPNCGEFIINTAFIATLPTTINIIAYENQEWNCESCLEVFSSAELDLMNIKDF